jgi:spermidine synthase
MTIAAIYPQDVKRVLMLGLGGGAITTYLGRFLPDATIDTVELDPGVIDVAKKYFGIRETNKSRLLESDGRVFLNRHREPYDIIIADAFTGSYIPFHLMTKEFYGLVRERLAPNGVAAFNILPAPSSTTASPHIEDRLRSRVDLVAESVFHSRLHRKDGAVLPYEGRPETCGPNRRYPARWRARLGVFRSPVTAQQL